MVETACTSVTPDRNRQKYAVSLFVDGLMQSRVDDMRATFDPTGNEWGNRSDECFRNEFHKRVTRMLNSLVDMAVSPARRGQLYFKREDPPRTTATDLGYAHWEVISVHANQEVPHFLRISPLGIEVVDQYLRRTGQPTREELAANTVK